MSEPTRDAPTADEGESPVETPPAAAGDGAAAPAGASPATPPLDPAPAAEAEAPPAPAEPEAPAEPAAKDAAPTRERQPETSEVAAEAAEVTAVLPPVLPSAFGEPPSGGVARFELITAADFARRSQPLSDQRGDPDEDRVPGRETAEAASRGRAARAEPHPSRADLRRRALARAIDVAIFALLSESVTYVGPLVALVYLLLGDGLFDGASVGKRLARLRVVRGRDGRAASVFDSLLRNAPLGIAGLFVLIPLVGWALFLTLGLLVVLFEGYLVFTDPRGVRAGDILAGTQVRDAIALPPAVPPDGPPATRAP